MLKDTMAPASPPAGSPLLREVWPLLAAHRPAVRQRRCFARLRALVLGHLDLGAAPRPPLTQVLRALGLVDADWSAFYRLFSRPRLDYGVLTRCFVRATLADMPPERPYVTVVDGVQVPRSSRTMPGTSWLHAPRTPPFQRGIHRAQRFLHLATLLPRRNGYSRALPLRVVPAFPPKAVPGAAAPQTEWQAAQAELQRLRTELDAAGRREQGVLTLGDGSFDVVQVWRSLPARTALLVRTAANRVLYALPPLPPATPSRGRPRCYGERAPTPQTWLHVRGGWQRTTLRVRGRDIPLRYRVEGPFVRERAPRQPLFLLVVKGMDQARGRHSRRRQPAFWLVSAVQQADGQWTLPLPAPEVLAWAWQRWEVEVSHRELKHTWGLGAMQCWHPLASVRSVQVRAWMYAVCVLAGYRAWGYDRHPRRPTGLWWRGAWRWSLSTLWQAYTQALHQHRDFAPGRAGIPGTWAEKETWLHHLDTLLATAVPG
jgi:hypothetical protein